MIKDFLYLQKSDRKVILALLCVIVMALAIIFLTGHEQDESNALTPADTASVHQQRDSLRYHRQPYVRTRVVYRDRPYRSSSNRGSYRESSRYGSSSRSATGGRDSLLLPRYPVKIRETEHVVLNTADTTTLMKVPGIGPYYARQIIRYGERLGGYVSVDQLDEIEDFPVESKRYFAIEQPSPRKLNLNQLSLSQLRRHPYIGFYQAKAITDYRRLHGPLKSLDDLGLSKDFSPELLARLAPYVEF